MRAPRARRLLRQRSTQRTPRTQKSEFSDSMKANSSLLPWIDVRVKHSDAHLAGVLVVGDVQQRRHICLVDRDLNLRRIRRPELSRRQSDLSQLLLPFLERELIHDL